MDLDRNSLTYTHVQTFFEYLQKSTPCVFFSIPNMSAEVAENFLENWHPLLCL